MNLEEYITYLKEKDQKIDMNAEESIIKEF